MTLPLSIQSYRPPALELPSWFSELREARAFAIPPDSWGLDGLDHTQPSSERGELDTAVQVLFQSARELLKAGQQGRAADHTMLYIFFPSPFTQFVSPEMC